MKVTSIPANIPSIGEINRVLVSQINVAIWFTWWKILIVNAVSQTLDGLTKYYTINRVSVSFKLLRKIYCFIPLWRRYRKP